MRVSLNIDRATTGVMAVADWHALLALATTDYASHLRRVTLARECPPSLVQQDYFRRRLEARRPGPPHRGSLTKGAP